MVLTQGSGALHSLPLTFYGKGLMLTHLECLLKKNENASNCFRERWTC